MKRFKNECVVVTVLFWYYLFTVSVIAKALTFKSLTELQVLEAFAMGGFLIWSSVNFHKRSFRVILTIVVAGFACWNLRGLIFNATHVACHCFGGFSTSIRLLTLVELLCVPLLFLSSLRHYDFGFVRFAKRKRLLLGHVILMITLVPWLVVFAPKNLEPLGVSAFSSSASDITARAVLPSLRNSSNYWLVVYLSPSCSKCKLALPLISKRLEDEWRVLLVSTDPSIGIEKLYAYGNLDRKIYILDAKSNIYLPGALPQAAVVVDGQVVSLDESEAFQVWSESLQIADQVITADSY